MENKKNLWLPICWAVYFVLVLVALLVPAISIKTGIVTSKNSIFDLFSVGGVGLSSSSVSVNFNQFYSILMVLTFFVPIFLSISKKEICKYFALALSITLFAFLLAYVEDYSTAKDAVSSVEGIHAPGLIMFFIASIIAMLTSMCDVFFNLYYDKIVAFMKASGKGDNKLAQLEETKAMLDKGLITQEEYEAKKNELLK